MLSRRAGLSAIAGLSCFLLSPTAKTVGRISSTNTSNDAFSAKDVPFGVRKCKFNIYLIYLKKSKKLQWGIWEKNFLKNLNCHNSGYTQDEVVIFGSMVWFSGSAYLMA